MKNYNFPRELFLFFIPLLALITSCSKNGEDSSDLKADAGDDKNVLVGSLVNLNGNGSFDTNGNPFEYSWKFILLPASSTATITDNTTASPSFTPDAQGKYKVELTVSNTGQDADTITVSAFSVTNVAGTFDNIIPGTNVGVRDFTTACGYLIATCEFTEIGGIEANKIAYFNGTNWNALGCGLEDGSIYDMIEYNGELYVTGQFEEIGCVAAANIARWNCNTKTWNDVEGGITGGDNPFGDELIVYDGELYVGGRFTKAGNVDAVNIARWDGDNWSAVGSFENGSVRSLEVYKQNLYAGGFFDGVDGKKTGGIAYFNGSTWNGLGSTEALELESVGAVKHMAVYEGVLYISGDFLVNNEDISELIMWNGNQLNDFGRAFSLSQNTIRELRTIGDVLYIGGEFHQVVASQANNLLQWDGETWGIMGQGISGTLLSIELYNNKIYLGGDFSMAGGNSAENISIWTEN